MVHCCVVGCHNKTGKPGISFHRFPDKIKRRAQYKQWLAKINRKDFRPSKNSYVCSRHFEDEDYSMKTHLQQQLMPNYKTQKILLETAIPSLFLKGMFICRHKSYVRLLLSSNNVI